MTDMVMMEAEPQNMLHWKEVVDLVHVAFQDGRLAEEAM